jgi:predicted RNase H-like nuclease (RuvC/YqgF family)
MLYFWQILTDIAIMEMATSAVKVEKVLKHAVETLCTQTDELLESIKESKTNVATLRDNVISLQMQVQQESAANSENKSETKESSLKSELLEAQLNLEHAQADFTVSSESIVVANTTCKVFSLIATAEKAYENSDNTLCSKSQARLHSQVLLNV